MTGIEPYLNAIFASAVCTAMVMFAFTRRRDGTRRIIFAVGAIIVVPVIVVVVMGTQSARGSDSKNWLIVGIPIWLAIVVVTWIAGMGWFGFARRVGDHPYCRRCGFDLFGKPAESTRCSECGAELDAKRAVVIGVRVRRYRVLAASIFLIFLGVLTGGRPTYEWATSVDWIKYKPMGWLLNDMNGSNGVNVSNAMSELDRRFNENEISPRQMESLAKFVLAQKPGSLGVSLVWVPVGWMGTHDDLDEATARGLIQLASQQGTVFIVPKVCRGMPIPFRSATGAEYSFSRLFAETTTQPHIELGGVELPAPTRMDDDYTRLVDPGELWSKIPDGPAQFILHVDGVVHFRSHGQNLTEPILAKFLCPAVIATGAAAEAPTTQPTATDLAATWTARFGDLSNPLYSDSRGLSIESTGASTRVVAHVILTDAKGRQDIGLFDSVDRTFRAGPAFRRPAGDVHLDLVPAPEATRDDWDRTPIVNQSIRITDVRTE